MKSIVCEDNGYCIICGRPKQAIHHLIFGNGMRKEADEEGLTIPICNGCHNMQYTAFRTAQIHENSMAEKLSKMLGEATWERYDLAKELAEAKNTISRLTGDENNLVTAEQVIDSSETRFLAKFGRKYI